MFNVTGGEIVIVLLLALIILGPDKLPGFIRSAGRFYGEVRKMTSGFKSEFGDVVNEPMREMRETANMARNWFEEGRSGADEEEEDQADGDVVPSDDGSDDLVDDLDDGDDDDDDLDDADDADDGDDDDDGDDGDDEDDDPNFYDEDGTLLDAAAIQRMIAAEPDEDTTRPGADPA